VYIFSKIYQGFGSSPAEQQKDYREFILGMDDEATRQELGLEEKKLIIGSPQFKEKTTEFFKKRGLDLTIRPRGRPSKKA